MHPYWIQKIEESRKTSVLTFWITIFLIVVIPLLLVWKHDAFFVISVCCFGAAGLRIYWTGKDVVSKKDVMPESAELETPAPSVPTQFPNDVPTNPFSHMAPHATGVPTTPFPQGVATTYPPQGVPTQFPQGVPTTEFQQQAAFPQGVPTHFPQQGLPTEFQQQTAGMPGVQTTFPHGIQTTYPQAQIPQGAATQYPSQNVDGLPPSPFPEPHPAQGQQTAQMPGLQPQLAQAQPIPQKPLHFHDVAR